jgi:HlyD family secretion protein
MKSALLFLVLIAVLATALVQWRRRQGQTADATRVLVSGNIEVDDVELSFRIPGWVEARLVSEGDRVEVGQSVARLEARELDQEVALRRAELQAVTASLAELEAGLRPEEIRQAQATLRRAQAALAELTAGSRPQEIAAGVAAKDAAEAEFAFRRMEYERAARLHVEGVAPDERFEEAKAAFEAGEAGIRQAEERLKLVREGPRREVIDQAQANVDVAEAALALARKGTRQERLDQARAQQEQARQALALAETRLGYAQLASPVSGVVLSKNVESGEYVSPGTPLVTVADLSRVWLRAYIVETDLGRVKLGQPVRVTTDTYPGKAYDGRVAFIASQAEFTPKNIQTVMERVKLVYRVKIEMDNALSELKPGMPADAEILLR